MTDSDAPVSLDLQSAINQHMPLRDGLSVLADQIRNDVVGLWPEERPAIEHAVDKRRWEFATSRRLAREAMAEIGLPPGPILRGTQREPIWPDGVLGSLTHADGWAVAAVARVGTMASLGVDLETAARVGENLYRKLFTEAEHAFLGSAEARMAGMLFSAKEAGYKATWPLVGRYIGFLEAEVDVHTDTPDAPEAGRFRLRYIGDHAPNQVMEAGRGYYCFCGRYVLSLVIIPPRD